MSPEAIRLAFVAACEAELAALKPGNVHVHAEGHGMTVAEFRTSAAVASGPLCAAGSGLGARILDAVEATRAAVGQNTNLGIVLLCAPLAMAAERAGEERSDQGLHASICQEARLGSPSAGHSNGLSGPLEPLASSAQTRQGRAAPGAALLKQVDSKGEPLAEFEAEPQPCLTSRSEGLPASLCRVLDGAGPEDAAAVFRAIALAAPGGLGEVAEHDVRAPPAVSLDVAMGAAAHRDSIARQWSGRFADILGAEDDADPGAEARPWTTGLGLAAHTEAVARGLGEAAATQLVFLRFLAAWPDSHVARCHGVAVAEAVREEARAWLRRFEADSAAVQAGLLAWDAALKRRGINPGTTADLTVAVLFALRIERGLQAAGDAGCVRRVPGPAGRAQ